MAADIGGTFTDIVLEGPSGRTTTKVLTTPRAPEVGVMTGIAQVLDLAGVTPGDVAILVHGTTLATNALIERKGARTAFLTTAGFRDILEMGFEKRIAQYDLDADRPVPLVPRTLRFTAKERVAADGGRLIPLDEDDVARAGRAMAGAGVGAVAIGFIHGYAHPGHERRAAEILAPLLPDATICLSSEVCPEMREYERFSTTCANAYVRPLMQGYLERLRTALDRIGLTAPLYLMMSGGGLTTLDQAARFPIRLVESGPAGGAILAADIAAASGLDRVLSFDMGGTTAKICLIEKAVPETNRSFEIARVYRNMKGTGLPVRVPVIEMVEIGAGGGSVVRVDAMDRIAVGPDSAGSEPGPVAYGRGGGEPTVTDANVVLGKIDPARFAGGTIALDRDGAEQALARTVGDRLSLAGFWPAAGVAEIVEENMANAARVHAIERGRDIARHTMIAFGGGAPLHAARLAEKLGIDTVVVPKGAGVGSAIGFLRAPVSYQVVRTFRALVDSRQLGPLNDLVAAMSAEARAVVAEGAGGDPIGEERLIELRYQGQGHELSIALPNRRLEAAEIADLTEAFEALYERIYGLRIPGVPVEAVSVSVRAATPGDPSPALAATDRVNPVAPAGQRPVYDAASGDMVNHGLYWRPDLAPGDRLDGPAVIAEDETSTIVPSGFTARIDAAHSIVLERRPAGAENAR
ncbi:MAG: hydantoinase/oxoprolinase family protein [Azospirillaceae bacterium]